MVKTTAPTRERLPETPPINRRDEYSTSRFVVPPPWVLNSSNKSAYVAFVLPVPFWEVSLAPNNDIRKCLELANMGVVGRRHITKDSEINGGEKE